MLFEKILVANRGEIACRVMRTARRLGVATVAVYSEPDREALHTRTADEAYCIGGATAAQSYLNAGAILETAKKSGAAAIHPGYGFLAENADFAEAVEETGLAFIGPPGRVIRLMGEKIAALEKMRNAGVAVLPGSLAAEQDHSALRRAAQRIGYPVMIKPSAGGGGKGMRIVHDESELRAAMSSSRREAGAAFGDEQLLLEKYLADARHIEVQVFADQHGNVVHLFERDCSIQRRHQKILEESPAPRLDADTRARLCETAVHAAASIGYIGAGTVEFLLGSGADPQHYFLEMNTRLQVEHPVTEQVTCEDLVEWQLRVAAGEPLPKRQSDLASAGHAIEARVYAEDPDAGFLPAAGRIRRLSVPAANAGLRIDSGLSAGDTVTVHYDPLLFKIIASGEDRCAALDRLSESVQACELEGVRTNLDFLKRVLAHPAYREGRTNTRFIEQFSSQLISIPADEEILALASLYILLSRSELDLPHSPDRNSPWAKQSAWRLNATATELFEFVDHGQQRRVAVQHSSEYYTLLGAAGNSKLRGELEPHGTLSAWLGHRSLRAHIARDGDSLSIRTAQARYSLRLGRLSASRPGAKAANAALTAPMPGTVIAVHVRPGDVVARGDPLMVMEAMKMEHTITAPFEGTVERVCFKVGERIDAEAELLLINA